MSHDPETLVIFCKVVDNYGDIGICWRLARQLAREHGMAVTLWVDDLESFRRICPEVDVHAARQQVQGVTVLHWQGQDGTFQPEEVADIVIEFFGVELPPGYVEAMAKRAPRPVWINYEGLSAEEWVEGCHTLPSMHPRLPLTKYFFFPGFTSKTGGLLHEAELLPERAAFDPAPFLTSLGLTDAEIAGFKVSLFCYPQAPVADLFAAWQHGARPVTCLVPEGVAADTVRTFLGREPAAGTVATQGMLTVRVLPFVPQPDYDKLLWSCDFNIVRGEDSWVRAQWAAKPFVWHIYPQDENLHHKKLRAFLQRYANGIGSLQRVSLAFNGACFETDWAGAWQALMDDLPRLTSRAVEWERQVLENGDLASNLLAFTRSLE
ncbi:MAG: elongation factor P maturation arginine rhamnosyltransferase EarP [Telluria sp.]